MIYTWQRDAWEASEDKKTFRMNIGSSTALVPAYQSAAFIQKTLDSLSAQTRENFRVVISVDQCEDDTYAICQAHCERDSRFSVFRQEQRRGYVGNCNFLLGQADSDYVFFAFHDDLLAPDYAAKLCRVLDARPDVLMAYSDLLLTYVNGAEETCTYPEMDGLKDPVERGALVLRQQGLWWVPNRGIFRLARARDIGGLKVHDAGEFSADFPWLFHMSLLGEFARVQEVLCFKYYMPGSITRSWKRTQRQYYALYSACLRELALSDLSAGAKARIRLMMAPKMIKLWIRSLMERIPSNDPTGGHRVGKA